MWLVNPPFALKGINFQVWELKQLRNDLFSLNQVTNINTKQLNEYKMLLKKILISKESAMMGLTWRNFADSISSDKSVQ